MNKDYATLSIRMPSAGDLHSETAASVLPAGLKPCFGVQITGANISSSQPNACAPAVGVTGGFVEENQSITMLVPKGEKRKVELLVFMAQPEEACPAWTKDTFASVDSRMRAFQAGLVDDVNIAEPEMTINMTVNFSGSATPMASQGSGVCLPTPTLRAYLLNNGDVLDTNHAARTDLSLPNFEDFYFTEIGGALGVGRVTTGGMLNPGTTQVQLPEWLTSLTRKPDLGQFYALDHSGQIYQVKMASSSVSEVVALTTATCPFSTTDCRVPQWIQSISAGFSNKLFGIDHSGQVYEFVAAGPTSLATNLGPQTRHFAFY